MPQKWTATTLKITSFTPDIDLSAPTKSFMTVSGTGFKPGATLVFMFGFDNGTDLTQPAPILGVFDFAGNVSVTASLIAWALGVGDGGRLGTQVGTFSVAVAYSSGSSPQPVVASASAQWNGVQFSNFSS